MFTCRSRDEQAQGGKMGEEGQGAEKRAERQTAGMRVRMCLGARGDI